MLRKYLKKVKTYLDAKFFFKKSTLIARIVYINHLQLDSEKIYSNLYDISMWPIKKMEKQNVNIQV